MAQETQAFFDGQRLQALLEEFPFELPDELPHCYSETAEALFGLVEHEVRRVNPWYKANPAELEMPTPPTEDGAEEAPPKPSFVKATSLLRAGMSALLVGSKAGFFDLNAGQEGFPADWRYRETNNMLLSVPLERFGGSLAICLGTRMFREAPGSESAEYSVQAGWELRIPAVPELAAFTGVDTDIVTENQGSIINQYFPGGTHGVIADMPVFRHIPGTEVSGPTERYSLGIIKGGNFAGNTPKEIAGIGAAILHAADRSQANGPHGAFKTVEAEVY